jgi:hypothetical protein
MRLMGTTGVRALAAVAGVGLVATVVVACGPPEAPPLPSTPTIVWSAGEPTSDLESDPWVAAVRAAAVPEAVATNALDTRSESLHSTVSEKSIGYLDSFLETLAGDSDDTQRVPGPWPFDPLSVEVAEDGRSAVVEGCSIDQWLLMQSRPTVPPLDQPMEAEATVVKLDDGTYRLDATTTSDVRCESDHLTIGTFEPLPVGDWEYDESDVLTRDDEWAWPLEEQGS